MKSLINSPFFARLDWISGFACLGWGAYLAATGATGESLLWIGGGLFGLAVAWYRPAQRLNARLNRRFVRRRESLS